MPAGFGDWARSSRIRRRRRKRGGSGGAKCWCWRGETKQRRGCGGRERRQNWRETRLWRSWHLSPSKSWHLIPSRFRMPSAWKNKTRETTQKCNVCNGNVTLTPNSGQPEIKLLQWFPSFTATDMSHMLLRLSKTKSFGMENLRAARSSWTYVATQTSLCLGLWPLYR